MGFWYNFDVAIWKNNNRMGYIGFWVGLIMVWDSVLGKKEKWKKITKSKRRRRLPWICTKWGFTPDPFTGDFSNKACLFQ